MRSMSTFAAVAAGLVLSGPGAAQETAPETATAEQAAPAPSWLPSLVTATPEEGFALAVALSRKGVSTTQPDREVLFALRPEYSSDADSLIAASHVVAVHFQTIAAANNYWRE